MCGIHYWCSIKLTMDEMKREIQFAMTKYRKRSYKLLTINCFNQLKITSKSAISPDENDLNRHNLERVTDKNRYIHRTQRTMFVLTTTASVGNRPQYCLWTEIHATDRGQGQFPLYLLWHYFFLHEEVLRNMFRWAKLTSEGTTYA